MVRKGRPVPDPFDPFESFDAHDQAAHRSDARGTGSGAAHSSGAASEAAAPAGPASVSDPEPTYSRSRRQPGETRSEKPGKGAAQRPVRSLKGRALAYLSRREYSRLELARKLAPYSDDDNALETLLNALEREGWLSDARFAESFVHRRAGRLGMSRIVNELKRHAVGETLIEATHAKLRETEFERAQAAWLKKFGELPQTPHERARQARFLAARGFSHEVIGKILKGFDED